MTHVRIAQHIARGDDHLIEIEHPVTVELRTTQFGRANREIKQRALVITKCRTARPPLGKPVTILRGLGDPLGDLLEFSIRQQRIEPGDILLLDRRSQSIVRGFERNRAGFAVLKHAARRPSASAQGKITKQVAAETVNRPDARRIDLGRKICAAAGTQRSPQFSLEIGGGLVRVGDCGDLFNRKRRGRSRHDFAIRRNRNAELPAKRLHNRCGFARARARGNKQMVGVAGDNLELSLREIHYHPDDTGPPGIRQMSRAAQYGEHPHDGAGFAGSSPRQTS